jgi:hypothetical protein
MNNYKTVECVFFTQNRCLKGHNCTFRHGLNDSKAPPRTSPPRFMRPIPHWHANITQKGIDEIELCKNLKIETWETYPRKFYYRIEGSLEECKQYYNEYILAQFPSNPYFTMITNEGENFIEVSRSTTCS